MIECVNLFFQYHVRILLYQVTKNLGTINENDSSIRCKDFDTAFENLCHNTNHEYCNNLSDNRSTNTQKQ